MQVLALDTATEACSVALLTEGGLFGRCEDVGRGHADAILGMVDATLAQGRLRLDQLDGIAASVGPGAFTGVRICVSVAQGLAFGAGLPVVAVTTLEALALQAMRGGARHVVACLDARMGEVYWGCFSAHPQQGLLQHGELKLSAAAAVTAAFPGVEAITGIGRGFAAYPVLASLPRLVLGAGAREALPDARDMATLGALRLRAGEGQDPAALTPRYLRNKVAFTEIERAAAKAAAGAAPRRPEGG